MSTKLVQNYISKVGNVFTSGGLDYVTHIGIYAPEGTEITFRYPYLNFQGYREVTMKISRQQTLELNEVKISYIQIKTLASGSKAILTYTIEKED